MTTPTESSFTTVKLAPDVMHTTIHGDLTKELLDAMVEYSQEIMRPDTPYIAIVDISELGNVTAEARVTAKDVPNHMPGLRGTVMVGGGFMQRMITKLLNIAMNLVSKQPIMLDYVTNDEEAMAVVETWRVKLRKEAGHE